MILRDQLVDYATFEAIHWWKRDEYFYHRIFSNILNFESDEGELNYFTNYFVSTFTKQYSVRRTIKSGTSLLVIMKFLIKYSFIDEVIKGNTFIVEKTIDILPEDWFNGRPVSFLSKFAFFINPKDFSLYDSLARNTINSELFRIENQKLIGRNYNDFIKRTNLLMMEMNTTLELQLKYLDFINESPEILFLKENPVIFKRRIFDKYLWIVGKNGDTNGCIDSVERLNRLWDFKVKK